MKAKTSLDRKISTLREYITKWFDIITFLMRKHHNERTRGEEESKFFENMDWCTRNYYVISKHAEAEVQHIDYKSKIKHSYPAILSALNRFQFIQTPTNEDVYNLKAGYRSLKSALGFLETKKESIGEIKIEEYEKIKSLIERLKLEHTLIDSLIELAESCEFLGLGFEWILSTSALQLQEVAMTLVAKQLGIELDKSSVSKILRKQFEKDVPFKDKYSAFCKEIKRSKDVTLSILPSDLRGMRTRILHQGISPPTNETKLITDFTCSFLKDLHHAIGEYAKGMLNL